MTTRDDRLSALLKAVLKHLPELGAMTVRAAEWEAGTRAQNLDPDAHGWRYTNCSEPPCPRCPHAIPVDPTGEAAGRRDEAAGYAKELQGLLRVLEGRLSRFEALRVLLLPEQPRRALTLKERHAAGADVAAEGYCRSCWRDDQTCNPIELRKDGTPYYRDRCRWCGGFLAAHGVDPPLVLLTKHHDSRRISAADVTRALTRRKRSA